MRLVIDLQGYQSIGSRMRGIGRYSLSLAKAMARTPRAHDVVIAMNEAIPDSIEEGRAHFEPLLPPENIVIWSSLEAADALIPEQAWRRSAGGVLFEEAMARLHPDFVHVSSLFEGWSGNVVSSIGKTGKKYGTAVTLYDLIPMQSPDTYLTDPWLRKWYEDRVAHLRRADLFLAISNYSRQEGISLLGLEQECIANISGSCSDLFHPVVLGLSERLAFNARYRIRRPYLLYTGGFDSRKNVPALIRTFASLPEDVRRRHQLVIVGYAPPHEAAQLESLRDESGLDADECIFAGYVPDEDLLSLYSYCQLYVFPSLHEGFGLPILEAMSCGAAVIGANRTSLPEVIGLEEAMFDPTDELDMRDCMIRGLIDEGFRERLQAHARIQARRFSWESCAERAWDALEEAQARGRRRSAQTPAKGSVPKLTLLTTDVPSWFSAEKVSDIHVENLEKIANLEYRARIEALSAWPLLGIVVDDADTLRQAAAVLEQRSCGVFFPNEELETLCRRVVSGPHLSDWVRGLMIRAGRYFLLKENDPRDGSAMFLADWVRERVSISIGASLVQPDGLSASVLESLVTEEINVGSTVAEQLLAEIEPAPGTDDATWLETAQCLAWNRRLGIRSGRLLIDMTELAKCDAGSGIQRVVRNIVRSLAQMELDEFSIHPVYMDAAGTFRHAHRHTLSLLGLPAVHGPTDDAVDWHPGDTFLGLDLSADALRNHPHVFERMKSHAISMYFVVYDLIPLLRPDCVHTDAVPVFQEWYRRVAHLADGLLCISKSVADELIDWLDQERPARKRPISIGYFHLGAELDGASLQAQAAGLPQELEGRQYVLMVGTIEPRKGYNQALDAFEQLWRDGANVSLVIVGKHGWMVDALVERIRAHPELGNLLFWYQGASDVMLQALYTKAEFVLCASEAEGFGLPLIEAALNRAPVLARDIPVFREVAGSSARLFSGSSPQALADAVARQLGDARYRNNASYEETKYISWSESGNRLLALLRGERWYARHATSRRRWFYATDNRLRTEVGERVGASIRSSARSGWLVLGPNVPFERGEYKVRVYGTVVDAPELWLELRAERGAVTLARLQLVRANQELDRIYEANIVVPRDVSDLEIRLQISQAGEIEMRALEVVPNDDQVDSSSRGDSFDDADLSAKSKTAYP